MTTSSLVIVGKMGQSQSKAFLIKRPSTGDEEDTYYHHSSLLAIGSCKKFGSADPIRGAARPTFPAWTAVVRRRQAACGLAVRRIPVAGNLSGPAPGRLSQGSYIPFLCGQGLEKWIRLPKTWINFLSHPCGLTAPTTLCAHIQFSRLYAAEHWLI